MLSRKQRWPANLGLVVLGALVSRLILTLAAFEVSLWASSGHFGLFKQISLPLWASVTCSIVILDCAVYWQHRLFHAVPFLWRIHKVHHADLDLDATSGARFHPMEIAISLCIKLAVIAFLGAPALGVILFEVILNGMAMFNHANLFLPICLDGSLRAIFVTPDMHRVHHSTDKIEHNQNFGFNLSLWDRIFRTYQAQPQRGHQGMGIGLEEYREPSQAAAIRSLMSMPFEKP